MLQWYCSICASASSRHDQYLFSTVQYLLQRQYCVAITLSSASQPLCSTTLRLTHPLPTPCTRIPPSPPTFNLSAALRRSMSLSARSSWHLASAPPARSFLRASTPSTLMGSHRQTTTQPSMRLSLCMAKWWRRLCARQVGTDHLRSGPCSLMMWGVATGVEEAQVVQPACQQPAPVFLVKTLCNVNCFTMVCGASERLQSAQEVWSHRTSGLVIKLTHSWSVAADCLWSSGDIRGHISAAVTDMAAVHSAKARLATIQQKRDMLLHTPCLPHCRVEAHRY